MATMPRNIVRYPMDMAMAMALAIAMVMAMAIAIFPLYGFYIQFGLLIIL